MVFSISEANCIFYLEEISNLKASILYVIRSMESRFNNYLIIDDIYSIYKYKHRSHSILCYHIFLMKML
jgi:hypothetical protein